MGMGSDGESRQRWACRPASLPSGLRARIFDSDEDCAALQQPASPRAHSAPLPSIQACRHAMSQGQTPLQGRGPGSRVDSSACKKQTRQRPTVKSDSADAAAPALPWARQRHEAHCSFRREEYGSQPEAVTVAPLPGNAADQGCCRDPQLGNRGINGRSRLQLGKREINGRSQSAAWKERNKRQITVAEDLP
jgi:hypothetical protein